MLSVKCVGGGRGAGSFELDERSLECALDRDFGEVVKAAE